MHKSESVANLAKALAAAQGELENASKVANNPHFKSKYADLAEIINTVRPVLSKHGLSIVQFPAFADGLAVVETILLHESGEFLAGGCAAPVSKQDAQGVGSAITYLRRYSLAAACGIAQQDDDAESAVGRGGSTGKVALEKVEETYLGQIGRAKSEAQLKAIGAKLREMELPDDVAARLLDAYNARKELLAQ